MAWSVPALGRYPRLLKTNQSHLQKFCQLYHSKLRMLTALDSRRITAMIDQYRQTEQEFKDSKGKVLALRKKLAKQGKGINGGRTLPR